jgi:hypothetical protein
MMLLQYVGDCAAGRYRLLGIDLIKKPSSLLCSHHASKQVWKQLCRQALNQQSVIHTTGSQQQYATVTMQLHKCLVGAQRAGATCRELTSQLDYQPAVQPPGKLAGVKATAELEIIS